MDIEQLRDALKDPLRVNVGDVVKFRSDIYDFAAIFAGNKRWYLTGNRHNLGQQLTTHQFLRVLRGEGITNIRVASQWTPVLEEEQRTFRITRAQSGLSLSQEVKEPN